MESVLLLLLSVQLIDLRVLDGNPIEILNQGLKKM